MKIECAKQQLDVQHADLSGSRFGDVNPSGANPAGSSIVNAHLEGATIDGVAVVEMLGYWRAGHGTIGA
jgi:uncharacterized protein YjbI with pentapeptide repeats